MPRIPIDISGGKIKETDVIVGIDLGTTNSLIAKMENGNPVAIADHNKGVIVPSVIHFEVDRPTVGETAKEYLIEEPRNTIYSVKRLMGKSYGDLAEDTDFFSYEVQDDETESLVKVKIGEKYFTPTELSSVILSELKQRAEHRLKTEVKQAVITVPAYFNDAQRQATRDAGKLAGLDVLRILNEPTAAALAYGIGMKAGEQKTVAVYDLGGGTFDVTLLQIEDGVFDVLSTHGDTYLGGDDFDRKIVEHWITAGLFDAEHLKNDRSLNQQVRLLAEEAKKTLSGQDNFTYQLAYGGQQYELAISRSAFQEAIQPLVARTIDSCRAALKDAELAATAIDEVILVGGSTRVPFVKSSVAEFFQKTPHDKLNPDEVVALGAAVQADILAGNRQDMLLLDVTPLSLGLETLGGLMDVLVPRNSKIPSSASRQYTTSKDGQSKMRIAVYQGEREMIQDNRKLGEFELSGIPAMPAGLAKVEITFMLDADGILRVSAKELRSGVQQEIEIKPQYGLTDEQVEQMLLESLENAQQDVSQRMVVEAREEAKQTLYNAENFRKKYHHYLSDEEMAEMGRKMQEIQQLLQDEQTEKDTLLNKLEAFDEYTKPFAERLMNDAVNSALSGKDLEEAGSFTDEQLRK